MDIAPAYPCWSDLPAFLPIKGRGHELEMALGLQEAKEIYHIAKWMGLYSKSAFYFYRFSFSDCKGSIP